MKAMTRTRDFVSSDIEYSHINEQFQLGIGFELSGSTSRRSGPDWDLLGVKPYIAQI
jgi:hypothetical protein